MASVGFNDLTRELRGFHPQFSEQQVPTVVARQFIVRAVNYVIGKAAEVNPDTVSVSGVVTKVQRDKALDDAENMRNRIEIQPFTQILGSIQVADADGRGRRVEIVSLTTQYPNPFVQRITFPALAIRDFQFELTDRRRLGLADHGWDDYPGDMWYDYVPYAQMPDAPDRKDAIEIPTSMRAAVMLAAAINLAKRADLMNYAATLDGQYRFEMDRIIPGATAVAAEA